jgi:hypothetical protein
MLKIMQQLHLENAGIISLEAAGCVLKIYVFIHCLHKNM